MTLSRQITSACLALAVAAGSIAPFATSAEAGSRHGHRYYSGDADWQGHRAYRHRPRYSYDHDGYRHRAYRSYGYDDDGHYYYRKKRRNHVGKAIAIGAGLIMLGIIANEAGRRHRY
jgi:hypothetical protein